jgi:hypothetical protein
MGHFVTTVNALDGPHIHSTVKEGQNLNEEDRLRQNRNYRAYFTGECLSSIMGQSPWEADIHPGGQEICQLFLIV